MLPTRRFIFCSVALAGSLLAVTSARAGTLVRWEASSGLLPDQIAIPYVLTDTAAPEDPVLGPAALTLSTSDDPEKMGYYHVAPAISVMDPLVIEARLRVLSGSGTFSAKAPADIDFAMAPEFGNCLHIDLDEIFLLLDNNVKGPSAVVDTNDAFHTYRIEVTAAGDVEVYYDDVLTLTGDAFVSASANGTEPRVVWGMNSGFAQGTAEWEYVQHNAGPIAVPALGTAGVALLAAGLLGFGAAVLRRRGRLS